MENRLPPSGPSGIQIPRGLKSALLVPLGILLLLIPSATFLWRFSDMPQFGDLQDDGIYYASAESLAHGRGYRIESLPGEPAQTKFPPLYPLLLSIVWRIDPQFPRNLPLAAWISWLALPAVLIFSAAYLPKLGICGWRRWLLLCLMAINPHVVFYSTQLMTELLFLALILSAMLLLERGVDGEGEAALPIAAGVIAGLAYLTRSAGSVMLPAAVVYFWLRGKRRSQLWFAAAMLPFIAGWTLWARLHQTHTAESVLMQYTDYMGSEMYVLTHVSVYKLLWKNLDGLIWGLGSLILPRGVNSQVLKILASAIGVAMISGVVRIVRRGHGMLYALFAAGSVLIMIVWCYPPDERNVLPLLPLALAGLLVEMEHLTGVVRAGLRHRDRSQRIVAGALAAATTVVLTASVTLEGFITFAYIPQFTREQRLAKSHREAVYRWIAANVPGDADFLAWGDDPRLFLYTRRHAITNVMPLTFWYQDQHSRMVDWVGNPIPFARAHSLRFLEFASADPRLGLSQEDSAAAERAIVKHPELTALYRSGPITVYALAQ